MNLWITWDLDKRLTKTNRFSLHATLHLPVWLPDLNSVQNGEDEEKKCTSCTSSCLHPGLPVLHTSVPEHDQAKEQADQGPGEVRLVAGVALGHEERGEDIHQEDPAHHQQAADPHHEAIGGCRRPLIPHPLPGKEIISRQDKTDLYLDLLLILYSVFDKLNQSTNTEAAMVSHFCIFASPED